MDPEIDLLVSLHPSLRGRLRRAKPNNCLLYTGPKIGRSICNPLLCLKRDKTTILLRRRNWNLHRAPLPYGKFLLMTCGNIRCHALAHMLVVDHKQFLRSPFLLDHNIYTRDAILLVRYFHKTVSQRILSDLSGIPFDRIHAIQTGVLFSEIRLPNRYRPEDKWFREVENAFLSNRSIHYLGPSNRKIAHRDVACSSLTPTAKKRLLGFIDGKGYLEIARPLRRDPTSVRESIQIGLRTLLRELGPKEWICLLLKKKSQ